MEQIEQLGKDIIASKIVMEYEKFRNDCFTNVNYIMNLERMELGDTLRAAIEDAKES